MAEHVMTADLPIYLASGEVAKSLVPTDYWPVERPMPGNLGDADKPIAIGDILAEEHHKYYGRPWVLGKFYFHFLLNNGLQPHHNVLDFGCGAGRVGIHLIPFLETGHYFGMDSHLKSLVAFARYEAPLHDLAPKQPRLILNRDCDVAAFGAKFDVILDLAVSRHFPLENVKVLYRSMHDVLTPAGRVFLPHEHRLSDAELAELGFVLAETVETSYPLLAAHHKKVPIDDLWRVYTKRS